MVYRFFGFGVLGRGVVVVVIFYKYIFLGGRLEKRLVYIYDFFKRDR